jgi:hypothetical protein
MRAVFRVLHSAIVRSRHLLRHLLMADIRQRIRLASRRYDTSVLRILVRIVRLYVRDRFVPNESLIYGLVNPAVPLVERRMHFAEERLHSYQTAINSPEGVICRDKLAFHSFSRDHGLPVPTMYAVISPLGSRSENGEPLATEAQWDRFVRETLPERVIVKPRSGKQGRDVRRITGTTHELTAGLRSFEGDSEDWLVQECLAPHDALVELTGTSSVSSLRIFTLMNEESVPEIMDAYLRVISGDSVTDNISDYATGRLSGNVVAVPDLASGIIQRAWRANSDGVGYQWLDTHPVTGHELKGFAVPHWEAVRALVTAAAMVFLPIRTAGWDVAITNEGPVLMEVNERFQNAAIGPATERFRVALERERARLLPVSARVRKAYRENQI